MSVATIDPGRPNLLMDHLQLGLRHGSGEAGAAGGAAEPHFYLSLYVIPWSREMGAGHVVLLRYRGADGPTSDMTLTDNPSLGRAQLANLPWAIYGLTSRPNRWRPPLSAVRSGSRNASAT